VSRTAAVACVTGAGTAPELMAEAVLALDAVGRLHGLQIDDTHVSFGGVALARAGQAVPAATRSAILGADAVLVAGGYDGTRLVQWFRMERVGLPGSVWRLVNWYPAGTSGRPP
jgi:isocitrate/isopropylmalate dehydrogenase